MRHATIIHAGVVLISAFTLIECSDTKPMSTAPGRAAASNTRVRPTPAPTFIGRSIDNVATRDIIAHARILRFDDTSPAADQITVSSPNGQIVHLRVDPEIGAAALTDAEIEVGRIIGRIYSSAAYAPLGLSAGTSYLWVQGSGDHARIIAIPESEQAQRTVRPLLLRKHATKADFATARYLNVIGAGGPIPLINTRCGSWCCSFTSPYDPTDQPLIDAALVEMHHRVDAITAR